mgnify:CR=1 FL=1
MRHCLVLLTAIMLAASAAADDGKPPSSRYTGLSLFADAGAYWGDRNTADFYSGRPEGANTILRVLHSNTYGTQIWNHLTEQQLISSAVGSYSQLTVDEYPSMYYRTSFAYGLGLRYDYSSGVGWLLRFDLARLNAIGAFNLSTDNHTGILSDNARYIRCGMVGREDRINIDFAITANAAINDAWDIELDLGGGLNNTKVRENMMEIAGATYSILDIWDGQSPDYGVGQYEYVNQGGLGWNLFVSVLAGYRMTGVGAVRVGYTIYRTHTVLKGYTANGWNHMLGIRLEINNLKQFNLVNDD